MQFNNKFSSSTSRNTYQIHSPTAYDPYRMTHNELRQVILKETLKLQELKRLYHKEQKILNQTYRDRICYNTQGTSHIDAQIGRHSFNNPSPLGDFPYTNNVSPIKILSTATKMQPQRNHNQHIYNNNPHQDSHHFNPNSFSYRLQYDQPESQLMNSSFGKNNQAKSPLTVKMESQKIKSLEKRLKNVEKTLKNTQTNRNRQQTNNLTHKSNKDNPHKIQSLPQTKSRRIIVYNSPQKSLNKSKQIKPEPTNDSIIAQINVQSNTQINQTPNSKLTKTHSTKKLKTRSKTTLFIRPKSYTNLKPIFTNQPLTLQSKVNQQIDHRLKMLFCVFRDPMWRNDKNQTDFLFNRMQMEEKGRRQIRSLVNNDTKVLKKHKMVVK